MYQLPIFNYRINYKLMYENNIIYLLMGDRLISSKELLIRYEISKSTLSKWILFYSLPLLIMSVKKRYTLESDLTAWEESMKTHNPLKNVDLIFYRFPFALLCVLHNIWQFLMSVAPPLLHAATWSASTSASFQILDLLDSWPIAHNGQFEVLDFWASDVCFV